MVAIAVSSPGVLDITPRAEPADARAAFDLIEKEPQRTIKVHIDFAG